MRPKVGDTVAFRSGNRVATGIVTWVGACGIDVMVGDDPVVTLDEEDILEIPKPAEGS